MTWTAESNLKGPKGDTGAPGANGGSVVFIGSTPPVDAPPNSLWYEDDTGMLFIFYFDGDSSQWVSVPGVPADSVRYGPQTLSVEQKTQARTNIAAAPFDALAYNGMQINGSFDVSQQRGSTAVLSTDQDYVCDGWRVSAGGGAVLSSARVLNGSYLPGIPNCLAVATTTAIPTIPEGVLATVQHRVEGYRASRVLAFGGGMTGPVTLAFYTAHWRAGLYSVSLRNFDGSRSYVATYTQNVANTWEYKTITIPGCPDGTWDKTTGIGLLIDFTLAASATFTAPAANVWSSGNFVAAPGQVNALASTSDTFRLTGVVVLPGTEAPSAERSPLIMRPFDQELLICQRYYEKSYPYADAVGKAYGVNPTPGEMAYMVEATGTYANVNVRWAVRKRAAPTATVYSPFTGAVSTIRNKTIATELPGYLEGVGETGGQFVVGNTQVAAGNSLCFHYVADARL